MKQTAVEWLVDELTNCIEDSGNIEVVPVLLVRLKEQAIAMEKEQIMDAFIKDRGLVKLEKAMQIMDNAEQYYNKTYKPKNP